MVTFVPFSKVVAAGTTDWAECLWIVAHALADNIPLVTQTLGNSRRS